MSEWSRSREPVQERRQRVSISRVTEEKVKKFATAEHCGLEEALERLVNLGIEAHENPELWA